jgi:hypothetical protein
MSIFERAFFLSLTPEDFVVAVRIERRVDVNQVNTRVGKFAQLIEIIAAVDDSRVDQRRGLRHRFRHCSTIRAPCFPSTQADS